MMSTTEDSGTTQTATASKNAFTTQIDVAGLACSCVAMLGRAVLAMLPSRTDMESPMQYVSIAQPRLPAGSPSLGATAPERSTVISDMSSIPFLTLGDVLRRRDLRSISLPANQLDCFRQVAAMR